MILLRRGFYYCNILSRNSSVLELTKRNFANATDDSSSLPKKNALIHLDPIELATGMYKRDILDKLGGEDDPYSVKMLSRVGGTKENPNMIPSAFDSRMVGCVCEEDSSTIVWMWLDKGESKRCQCGHWFQLYHQPMFEDKSSLSV